MKMLRGDTLVEVLLATVVLSIIMAGSYSLTSRATRLGQSAIERTEASKRVEEQIETLRAMHAVQSAEWVDEFVEGTTLRFSGTEPDYSTCSPTTGSNPFYVDVQNLSSLNLSGNIIIGGGPSSTSLAIDSTNYANSVDARDNDIFGIWVEAYRPTTSPDYIDFHVRACWNGLGSDVVNRSGSILRLSL